MGDELAGVGAEEGAIGGWCVEEELSAGRTWLARGPGGRRVVLKVVESDCLMGEQLHPMIRDRLGRVRELAHVRVANLLGVERCGEQVYLVWEYVEGETLEAYAARREKGSAGLQGLARQLVQSVEGLHALGIVHGAIHGRNVIVRGGREICLTHVSPLLYNDIEVDLGAAQALLEEMACGRWQSERGSGTDEASGGQGEGAPDSRRWRRGALLGALLAAVVGGAVAWRVWRYAEDVGVEQAAQEMRSGVERPGRSRPGAMP
jgi:hypothetical protein